MFVRATSWRMLIRIDAEPAYWSKTFDSYIQCLFISLQVIPNGHQQVGADCVVDGNPSCLQDRPECPGGQKANVALNRLVSKISQDHKLFPGHVMPSRTAQAKTT